MKIKAPSYKGLSPASEASSRAKRNNTRKDTKHEVLLRKALWHVGLRFRKNVESMPGKPDIVFSKARVVVFCDGDFWHGRKWESQKEKLRSGTNSSYWLAKIASNIVRDKRNTELLESDGWKVIRLWESDILRDSFSAAHHIKEVVLSRQAGSAT